MLQEMSSQKLSSMSWKAETTFLYCWRVKSYKVINWIEWNPQPNANIFDSGFDHAPFCTRIVS
jgi:hypothetical protein